MLFLIILQLELCHQYGKVELIHNLPIRYAYGIIKYNLDDNNLVGGIINQLTIIAMWRSIFFLSKWSLQITGASIIGFNFLSETRQQQIKGSYYAAVNSYRCAKLVYQLGNLFKSDVLSVADRKSSQFKSKLTQFNENAAASLTELCMVNKGVYAKIAFNISRMKRVFPDEYTTAFSKLDQSSAEPLPYAKIKKYLEQKFQKPTKELFDQMKVEPFRVGLVCQLHKAVLMDNFKEIIVKVKLPYIQSQYGWDIWFINKVKAFVLDRLQKEGINVEQAHHIGEIINDIQAKVKRELNFIDEVENASKFREILKQTEGHLYVPYYYKKYCTDFVIFREYIEGAKILDIDGLKKMGVNPLIAMNTLVQTTSKIARDHRIFNGSINQDSVYVRKVVTQGSVTGIPAILAKKNDKPIAISTFQVVLLDNFKYQEVKSEIGSAFLRFWEKSKSAVKNKAPINLNNFYDDFQIFAFPDKFKNAKNKAKSQPSVINTTVQTQKLYLYEPIIQIFNKLQQKINLQANKTKSGSK